MTDNLTASKVLSVAGLQDLSQIARNAGYFNLAEELRDEAARREAVETNLGRFGHHPDPAIDYCVEVECLEGMAYDRAHGIAEHPDYPSRLAKADDFKVGGDQNAVAARQILHHLIGEKETSQPDAPPSPTPDGIEALVFKVENAVGVAVAKDLSDDAEEAAVAPHRRKLLDAIEALRAERDAQKRRGDNHWETLRSIREIARTSGDLERIIQWVSDAGQGYTESAETTLSKEMDARKTAEARAKALEGALQDVIATDHHNLSDGPPPRYVTIARQALAAGGGNG